jgi:hypothetical protein
MDDPQNTPDPGPPEEVVDPGAGNELKPSLEVPPAFGWNSGLVLDGQAVTTADSDTASRRRSIRRNLSLLLSLSLAAFVLTSWILVRVEAPFGIFLSGPQEIVRAQLRALDRGELRPAYDMF